MIDRANNPYSTQHLYKYLRTLTYFKLLIRGVVCDLGPILVLRKIKVMSTYPKHVVQGVKHV